MNDGNRNDVEEGETEKKNVVVIVVVVVAMVVVVVVAVIVVVVVVADVVVIVVAAAAAVVLSCKRFPLPTIKLTGAHAFPASGKKQTQKHRGSQAPNRREARGKGKQFRSSPRLMRVFGASNSRLTPTQSRIALTAVGQAL